MTIEEKNEYIQKLAGRIVPNLLKPETQKELDSLTVMDLIIVESSANFGLEKGFLKVPDSSRARFRTEVTAIHGRIAKKLLELPELYVIFDKATRMPFLDIKNRIFVFSELEYAEEAIEHYKKEYRNFECKVIDGKNIENFLGMSFYLNGAEGVLVNNGQKFTDIAPGLLVPPPDFTGVPEVNIPIMNPELNRAMLLLIQEVRWNATYQGKEENVDILAKNMIDALKNARFLVPVQGLKESSEKTENENEVLIKKNTNIQIALLESKDGSGDKATPIFTDWNQFRINYNEPWEGLVITAKDAANFNTKEIVLNLNTYGYGFKNEWLKEQLN